MKPARFALSLRTLMFLILLAGLIAFGWVISSRSTQYQRRANWWRQVNAAARQHVGYCQQQIAGILRAAKRLRSEPRYFDRPGELALRNADDWIWWRANLTHAEAQVSYSEMLRHKYELAARFPWFTVEPDPPLPSWSGQTEGASYEELAELETESAGTDRSAP